MRERKNKKIILTAFTAVAALAVVALWQFYLFVTFKNAAGVVEIQGGTKHLWWAIGFGLIAFVGAFLFASFFLRYDRNNEMHITSPPSRRETIF